MEFYFYLGRYFSFYELVSFPSSYGVINDQFYLRVFRDGSGMELHNILDSDPGEDVKHSYISETRSLKKIADGLYETAKYMLYHNNN